MLGILAAQLPFSVCLVWFLFMLMHRHKSYSYRLFTVVMGLFSVSFLCGANMLSLNPNYHRQLVYSILMIFSSLAVPPLVCFYLRSLFDDKYIRSASYLALLLAVLLCGSAVYVMSLLGFENCAVLYARLTSRSVSVESLDVVERTYYLITFVFYRMTFFALILSSLAYFLFLLHLGKFRLGHIPGFVSGRRQVSFTSNILSCLFFLYFSIWFLCVFYNELFMNIGSVYAVLWSVLASVLFLLIGYVAVVPPLPGGVMSRERLLHPFASARERSGNSLDIDSSSDDQPRPRFDSILDSFNELMITNQEFLNPQLTIDEVSRQLDSNRTYVSKLVNTYYGVPFRDYLCRLRMDYAKQLMIDEPDAPLDYISTKSGFQSSTQFIRKFRETEGVTPTAWRTSSLRKP